MRRLGFIVALLLAVLLTAQPLLHNHSLIEKVATPCPICAFGADRTIAAPVIDAPRLLAYRLTAAAEMPVVVETPRTTSSRAPPRA